MSLVDISIVLEPERVGCGGLVCVAGGDADALSEVEVRAELVLVKRSEARLASWKSELLASLDRRRGVDAQQVAGVELMLSGREAKTVVDNAVRLQELPKTKASLAAGDIGPKQADLIAKTFGEGPVDEATLVDAAQTQNIDVFANTVREHQSFQDKQTGLSRIERQRKRRSVKVFDDPASGLLNLHAVFDSVTGAKVMAALTAKENSLWKNNNNGETPQQRRADALAELICEQGNPQGTDLLIIAEVDVVKQQLKNSRLLNGNPITDTQLRELAVEANIIPAVFNTNTTASALNSLLNRRRETGGGTSVSINDMITS